MRNGFAVFFAVFVALGASWGGFVVAPAMQLGREKQTTVLNSSDIWPQQPTGAATLGLQVYRANACAACHTEQVRQDGMAAEVTLTGLSKEKADDFKAFIQSLVTLPEFKTTSNNLVQNLSDWNGKLPKTILTTSDKDVADAISDHLKSAGLKSEETIVATGPDIPHWGPRRSVAADYLYDYPVQLGDLRVGPDLANVGARLPDANWQLVHLYAPRAEVKNSEMPSFKFLFELRKVNGAPSPDALQFPKDYPLPAGYEVVPKPEAKQLVTYLLSLREDQPLYEAPFTPVTTKP